MRGLGASSAAIGSLRRAATGCAFTVERTIAASSTSFGSAEGRIPRRARNRGSPRRSSDRRCRRPARQRSRAATARAGFPRRCRSAAAPPRSCTSAGMRSAAGGGNRRHRDRCGLVGEDRRRMRPRLHEQRVDQDRQRREAGERRGHRVARPAQHASTKCPASRRAQMEGAPIRPLKSSSARAVPARMTFLMPSS